MTPCWIWTKAVGSHGYGALKVGGKVTTAHRFAFEQRYGPMPSDVLLHHVCAEPLCYNPDHLQVVDQSQHRRMHRGRRF